MTTLTVQADGVTTPDNWVLVAGASKAAAVNTPDDGSTSCVRSTTTANTVQTFTCTPALPSGATISQVAIRARAIRNGTLDANFVMGYSFTKQGGGTQSGESTTKTASTPYADHTYTHSGLSANWGSGFTFYVKNTQTREVKLTTFEVEFTYTALEILPGGLAVGAAFGSATVWSKKVVKAVAAGNDDGEEQYNGAVNITGTVAHVSATAPYAAFIFRNITLADEYVVSAAHLRIYANTTTRDSPGLTLQAEGNPADLAATNYNISSRTLTTAEVDWTAADIGAGWQDSPDISDLIDELRDNGWTDGDDIAIVLSDNGTGGEIDIRAYETGHSFAELVIEWDFPPAALEIIPGGLAVGLTLGGPAVGRGAVAVEPDGLAVGAGLGDAAVTTGTVNIAPAGKAVAAAFGAVAVAVNIAPAGKAVAATIGTLRVAVALSPDGLPVGLALGDPEVGRGAVGIAPSGLAVGLTLGAVTVSEPGAAIFAEGLAVGLALGDAEVTVGTVDIAPAGLAVAAAFGTARLKLGIAPAGLGIGVAFGTALVGTGGSGIAPAGLAVGVAFGETAVGLHIVVYEIDQDGYEDHAGNVYLTTTSLNVNYLQPCVAFRVADVSLPAGVTVVTAYLEVRPITYDDPALEIYLEDSGTPAALTTAANDISDRTGTGATPWVATNAGTSDYIASPGFGPAVKAVIDREDYAPGTSDLVVILRDLGQGGWIRMYSDDAGAEFRPRLVVVWAWGDAALDIAPYGLALAATTGEAVVTTGVVGVTVDEGTAVALASGTAVVSTGAVGITVDEGDGLAVAVAVGDATVSGGAEDIAPDGLAVAVAYGSHAVGHGLRLSGLAVAVGIGGLTVGRGGMGIEIEDGTAAGVAIGDPVVSAGGAVVRADGMAVAAGIGGLTVGRGTVDISPDGLAVGLALGDATVMVGLTVDGLAVGLAVGDAVVGLGAVDIAPAGKALAAGFGTAVVTRGVVDIAPDGFEAGVGIGSTVIGLTTWVIEPDGVGVGLAMGDHDVAITMQHLRPAGLSAAAVIGALVVIAARTPASRIYDVPRRQGGN